MTLNDLERRNMPNGCLISPTPVAFWADCVKVLKIHGNFLRQKCRPKDLVFNDISFMAILAGDLPSDSVKLRHFPLASENWAISWKRCKIGSKLLLITNRKWYMSFRLVPKLVTLNDLERRNGLYIALFH